jgi:hypothetical protein
MKGRVWLVLGVVVGVAIGIGKLPYFDGAATSLCDTALRVVDTGGLTLIHGAAKHGAPQRVVEGLVAILAILVPGVTALLLIVAARATLRLREVIAVLLAALGIASFFYLPGGTAVGVALFALLAAGLVVVVTGPFVVAPLAALASLIATVFLPKLVRTRSSLLDDTDLGSSPGAFLDLWCAALATGDRAGDRRTSVRPGRAAGSAGRPRISNEAGRPYRLCTVSSATLIPLVRTARNSSRPPRMAVRRLGEANSFRDHPPRWIIRP